jgi:hypothetical protein
LILDRLQILPTEDLKYRVLEIIPGTSAETLTCRPKFPMLTVVNAYRISACCHVGVVAPKLSSPTERLRDQGEPGLDTSENRRLKLMLGSRPTLVLDDIMNEVTILLRIGDV